LRFGVCARSTPQCPAIPIPPRTPPPATDPLRHPGWKTSRELFARGANATVVLSDFRSGETGVPRLAAFLARLIAAIGNLSDHHFCALAFLLRTTTTSLITTDRTSDETR